MAINPLFSKNGVTRTAEQGVSYVPNAGFSYDVGKDVNAPTNQGLESILGELNEYLSLIDASAADLIANGKADQAANLRQLGDRLKRTANTRGVSAEQIARQMSDVTNVANTQFGLFQSKIMADKLSKINQAISQKTGVQQALFNQDLQRTNLRENILKSMEKPSVISPTGSSSVRSSAQRDTRRPVSPTVRRSGYDGSRFDKVAQMGKDFRDKMNISKFLDEKDRGDRVNNPLFQGAGSSSNTAQAGLAVTQMNRGMAPGLFKPRGVLNVPESRFAPAAPTAPTLAPGWNADGGFTAPMNRRVVPVASNPIGSMGNLSNKSMSMSSPTSSGAYTVAPGPRVSPRKLKASGKKSYPFTGSGLYNVVNGKTAFI